MIHYYERKEDSTFPIGVKIYYADGSVLWTKNSDITIEDFNSLFSWFDSVTKTGIEVIVIFENTFDALGRNTKVVMAGSDYYFYDKDTNRIGQCVEEYPPENTGWLIGTWVDDATFESLYIKAISDYSLGGE